jgi:AraC-like DNA-binding protein
MNEPILFANYALGKTCQVLDDRFRYGYPYFHYHKQTQLSFVVHGKGVLSIGEHQYEFKAGDIFFISSNTPHRFYELSSSSVQNHYIHVLYEYDILQKHLDFIPEFKSLCKFLEDAEKNIRVVNMPPSNIFENLMALKKATPFEGLIQLLQFLSKLANEPANIFSLDHTGNKTIGGPRQTLDSRISDILQIIHKEFTSQISLMLMAKKANMSVSAFCKFFRQHTNRTFHDYIIELRIRQACSLLLQNKHRIVEIAYLTGFQNAISFNRAFKKQMGQSPGDYKRLYTSSIIEV